MFRPCVVLMCSFYSTDIQGILSRPNTFDGVYVVTTPDNIIGYNVTRMWLNIEVISLLISFYDSYINDKRWFRVL